MKRARRYVDTLHSVPEFRSCSHSDLSEIARLIDAVDLPAGTVVGHNAHEVVLLLESTRVLVIGKRAWPAIGAVIANG